jgi:hypothetical protein
LCPQGISIPVSLREAHEFLSGEWV